jgi:hypothetical protein
MPKFTLKVDHSVTLFSPRGYGSMVVEPEGEVDVPGVLVTSRPEPKEGEAPLAPLPDDAYIVVNNGEEKAWPHALWVLAGDKPVKKTEPVKAPAVKEN